MDRFCINCGSPLGPTGVCPNCGCVAPPEPAPKKKKGKLILILAAVLLAALLILILLFVLGVFSSDPSGKPGKPLEDTLEPVSAEEYFAQMGTITGRKPAKDVGLKTEAEAVRAFAARGFDSPVTAYFSADGDYLGELEVSDGGSDRHPYYETTFALSDGAVWTVVLMGESFYAVPVSFNAESRWDAPRTLSESGSYLVYDDRENAFCTLDPKEDGLVLKRVDRIDAETLDGLDAWEVDDL